MVEAEADRYPAISFFDIDEWNTQARAMGPCLVGHHPIRSQAVIPTAGA